MTDTYLDLVSNTEFREQMQINNSRLNSMDATLVRSAKAIEDQNNLLRAFSKSSESAVSAHTDIMIAIAKALGAEDPDGTLAPKVEANTAKILQHTYSLQEIKHALNMQDSDFVSLVGNNEVIGLPCDFLPTDSGDCLMFPKCRRYGHFYKMGGVFGLSLWKSTGDEFRLPGYVSKIELLRGFERIVIFEMTNELLSHLPSYGVPGNEILFGGDGHVYYLQTATYAPVHDSSTLYGRSEKLENDVVTDITEYINFDGCVDILGDDYEGINISGDFLLINIQTTYDATAWKDTMPISDFEVPTTPPAYTEFYYETV